MALPQGSQRIGGLAALADDDGEGILLQDGITIAELAGHIHLHRQAGQALEHIPCRHAHVVGGAAADDIQTADGADGVLIQGDLGQVDAAVLDAGRKGIPHRCGLLVDLLHHEMLIAAFFGCFGIPLDGGGRLFDALLIDVVELNVVRRHADDLLIVNVVDRAGVLEQGRNVGGDQVALFRCADDEGAVLADRVDYTGLVGKQNAQGIAAADVHHHAGDGVQRIARRLAAVIVIHHLGDHFGVGLGGKIVAAGRQAVLEFLIVFNDAVMDHRDLVVTGIMGVRVDGGRLAVGRPAGVADAAGPGDRGAAVGHFIQNAQAAFGLDDLDLACGVLHRDTG